MSWKNIRLIFMREVRDQLRDRRTLFMITILPVMLYPMLGLGIVEMMLTFSEQRRNVVILNTDQLPADPALLAQNGIAETWFANSDDASKLRIVTDLKSNSALPGDTDENKPDIRQDGQAASRKPAVRGLTDEQLLEAGRRIQQQVYAQYKLLPDGVERTANDVAPDPQTQINQLFETSGIQVLICIPPDYSESLKRMQDHIQDRGNEKTEFRAAPILIVKNSADDKSVVAAGRIKGALDRWEEAIRAQSFQAADLPAELHHPARLTWIEVARDEQVAASVWSKMFPALLVIMALTGAFYPAIDLGAGEKERGTMETLLISPARRVELVLGKFGTIMLFSICTALLNLVSMGFTGKNMAMAMGGGLPGAISLELPGASSLIWLFILLIPLAALFSALCLALATFARSTKEGQYYLTPLLMVVMGMTMFCLSPAVEMTPLYSVLPVVNVALLLKGLLLETAASNNLVVYAVPVLISSLGYSLLALWWAIELYNSEDVLFREAEKFDLRHWFAQLLRTKDSVPAFPEAVFCFVLILMLQFGAMSWLQPDLKSPDAGRNMMRLMVIQQMVMIACPAVFMGVLLTTSLRATFRLRMPSLQAMATGIGLACVAHPLSVELSQFLVAHQVFPPLPDGAVKVMGLLRAGEQPTWLLIVVFALTPAICEELAFRGFILSGLARGGRLAIAVVISSMMFGIVHMIPQQAFNAGLLGLVLGILAIYSRSLFPAIAFHLCNNAIATLHAGGFEWIRADGVFFTRDVDHSLRYEAPLLILCGVAAALMIIHMVREIMLEQDLKRRGIIPSYHDSSEASTPVACTES
ncbi:MAG: CPBP family intramembrane metalloprotease [Planctomycetaceae bacterium]|nr:CPBP family intramembrane metalloprotease [Planctomycetaceae bacterium]